MNPKIVAVLSKKFFSAMLPGLLLMGSACVLRSQPQIRGNSEAMQCVVLLHGLARTSRSMGKMEKALLHAGYRTVNLDYPSRSKTVEKIAAEDLVQAIQLCEQSGAEQIHFVCHSLGAIVLRQAMSIQRPENLGRVVMLSPPNKGSAVAERLKNWWPYRWFNGPAGQQLGTGGESLAKRLGPVDYEVGVITGNRHVVFDAWFASFIPEENDGKISVEEAKLEGMADFLVVPETHPFIMTADPVIEQTIHFLRNGLFYRP